MEMYPTYTAEGGESVYEEHDISTMPGWNRAARISSPAPPRSSFSSPPPSNRYRTSFDNVALYSASPRSPAPSSAPPAYPPVYPHPNAHSMYYGYAAQSEPSPDNYYWYAGAPPSVASSQTRYNHSPSSAPGDMYSREEVPGFFGIRAPHHHPGNSSRQAINGENLPNFPQWSRTWYDGHLSANGHAYTSVPPPDGASGWESDTLSRSGGLMPGSYGHVYGARGNVADMVKEERIRMLEKQFGKPKISHNDGGDDDNDTLDGNDDDSIEDIDLPLGAVTSQGKLVTERPKWKVGIRWLIGIVAIACFALGIGSALLIKPGLNAPAARGSIASYILYIASAITLVLLLYLFVFRPCCCDPMRKEMKMHGGSDNPLAGMVIPILSAGGGAGGKMKKKAFGKGKRGMAMMQQAPTVNLIVDPALLGIGENKYKSGRKSEEDPESNDERLPGDARRSSRRKNGVGVLGNMQMQRRWMMARKTLQLETVWDAILCIVWIAVVIVVLGFGKKCPPGGGNGWCNYYNGAIACGAIMAALLAVVLYLDYRDLKVSKKPPKPPM